MALKIIESITNKILVPFRLVPRDGLTPQNLAFSITIGIVSGIFPVLGLTTVLSILLTMAFRQNLLVVQSVQWLLAFVQLILIIPFMQFGAYILNAQIIHISIEQISTAFQPGLFSGLRTLGIFHLYAILTWIILSIPAGAISYFTFRAVFQKKYSNSPDPEI